MGSRQIVGAKQVDDLFVVDFQKTGLNDEIYLVGSFLYLPEELSDDSGDDTHLFIGNPHIGCPHSVGFATAGLSVGQYRRIVPIEATHN